MVQAPAPPHRRHRRTWPPPRAFPAWHPVSTAGRSYRSTTPPPWPTTRLRRHQHAGGHVGPGQRVRRRASARRRGCRDDGREPVGLAVRARGPRLHRGRVLRGRRRADTRDGGHDYAAVFVLGDHAVRVSGTFRDDEAVDAALAGLEVVPAAEWVGLLPDDAVLPSARGSTVDEMLTGIPLPPGFDPAALRSASTIASRYDLGAAVTGSVACRWIDSWVAGRVSGDAAAVQAAVDAMGTSPNWAILQDMAD